MAEISKKLLYYMQKISAMQINFLRISAFVFAYLCVTTLSLNISAQDIVYPKNNQVLSDTSITLQWDEIPNTTSYQLQIATDSLFQNILLDSSQILHNHPQISLPYGSYFFHIKPLSIPPSPGLPFSRFSKFTLFYPKAIDSLVLWLSADTGVTKDANNKVSQWSDLSGYNNNFQQSAVLKMPKIGFDKWNYLSFDGNDYLYSSVDTFNKYSLIVFHKPLMNNNYNCLLSKYSTWNNDGFILFVSGGHQRSYQFYNNNANSYVGKTYLPNHFNIDELIYNGITRQFYLNKTKSLPKSTNQFIQNNANLIIGHLNTSSNWDYNGKISEIIIYAKPLDSAQIQLVNKYLLDKYTPPVNLGPNILRRYGFCDTTLTTEAMYESYLWSTGDTTRSISISKEDTGWYWCEVPNLYGDIMRDSVYVYNLLPVQDIHDSIVCYGDSVSLSSSYSLGYSNLWSDLNTGDTLSSSQTLKLSASHPRTIALEITDTLSCFTTDTFTIYIDSFPAIATLGPDTSLCSGDKIGLVVGQSQADSFLWSNGTSDSLLIVNTAGTYSLIVHDTLGCVAKDTITAAIHGITPYVSFSADAVCFRDSTLFIDSSQSLDQSNLIQWKWEFGDDSLALALSSSPVQHLYPDSGTYTAKLTVSTDSGCANYAYRNVYVRPLPKPDFYPLLACQNHELTFANLSFHTDSLSWFYWDLGNGKDTLQTLTLPYSSLPSFTTVYDSSGTYNVMLKAADFHGCADSVFKNVDIRPSPLADFLFSTSCEGSAVNFSDNSLSLPYNPVQSYQWDFGTPPLQTSPTPSFLFPAAGFYPVKLTIMALNGCWDTITKGVQVHRFPKADFYHSPACFKAPVDFYDKSTVIDDTIVDRLWNFYDYGLGNGTHVVKTFNDSLSHNVWLQVTTNAGCKDTVVYPVKVQPLPYVDFSVDKEYGLPPLEIQFTNLSKGLISSAWDFGDGYQSNVVSPTHTYTDSAVFRPVLVGTNKFFCSDSSARMIYAVYAAIDVAVTDVVAQIQNGYISFACTVTNLGKMKLRELGLTARYNSGAQIYEQWQGELTPGASLNYTFTSKIKIPDNQSVTFYCVDADVTSSAPWPDENPANNTLCKNLDNIFWVGSPYPNPATDKLYFDMVLPSKTQVHITVFDVNGKIIDNFEYHGKKGLNNVMFPVNKLSQGSYTLKVETSAGTAVIKFVK